MSEYAGKYATLPTDSAERKGVPLARGVLDYFPAALAAVARLSQVGNDKHNPGEDMHHARGKSSDHADCILRHLVERGTYDTDNILHDVKVAWRALALLQETLENLEDAPLPRGARRPGRSRASELEALRELYHIQEGDGPDTGRSDLEVLREMYNIQEDDGPETGRMVPVITQIHEPDADGACPNNIHERIAGDSPQSRKLKNQYYGGTEWMPGTPVVCDDGWRGNVTNLLDTEGERLWAEVRWTHHADGQLVDPEFITVVEVGRLEHA